MRLDQRGVGGSEGVRPDVALVDVADAVPGERRHPRRDDRAVADVQGLGGQDGRDADVQVLQAALAAGDCGEGLQEAWLPAHHLQDQLTDVDAGHHGLRTVSEVHQARGIGDGGQR